MQNAQGKGQTWFPGKTAVDVDVRYFVGWTDTDSYLRRVSEGEAGQLLRKIKTTPELAEVFTVTREVRTRIANACAYCGARPRTWDWDCDGNFESATCDSEQCPNARI
jgi:hypothetical protein